MLFLYGREAQVNRDQFTPASVHSRSPSATRRPRNRIVSTPHGPAYGEHGGLTVRYIRYHEEKAKGGCAW
jgi:hypothetical protein